MKQIIVDSDKCSLEFHVSFYQRSVIYFISKLVVTKSQKKKYIFLPLEAQLFHFPCFHYNITCWVSFVLLLTPSNLLE
jgi:hypothetical protein